MKTIEDTMYHFTGHGVIEALCQVLRENDPEFADCEEHYANAVDFLRNELPSDMVPALDAFLNAREADVISRTVSAGYLGYRVNLENFHHPIGIDFVHLNTIDYLKDQIIGHFEANRIASKISASFSLALPDALQPQLEVITEYYVFLECTGPKLAHYAGYVIANHLLPWVEPGYRVDRSQTSAFQREMKKLYGYLPI